MDWKKIYIECKNKIIFQLAILSKNRAKSFIKYISPIYNFIKNQMCHYKRHVPLSGSKKNCAIAKKLRSGK